ncbi:glycosyltransferase family 9 protein [Legionella sp. W05-934-2]|jgi:ADP-heptose:LPS heptosyltransferase|uniref:glycosyltransferase family 9 protein n=1 Tax=Legionella sp. W05-934-2 TaxID=1198649 RepID=UPI00346302CC
MKILIVRIGRLGDMVMILPALAEIKKTYPNADIYALTSPDGVRLLKAHGVNPNHIHCYSNHFLKRPQQVRNVRHFLNQNQFDKVFCFEKKPRTVAWLPETATMMDDSHADEHYALRCIKLINPQPDTIRAVPYLTPNDVDIAKQLGQYGITSDTFVIGLHPTYSGFDKWGRTKEKRHRLWPPQSFASLISALTDIAQQRKLDMRFMMDLLPEERQMGERILSLGASNLVLQCEPPNFQRFLNYLKRVNVFVAPNTGVMHLAAALNTPTVALFSAADPGDCGPYMHPDRFRIVHSKDYANENITIASIPVQPVVDAVLSLLPKQ